jgi:hypothetical protein
MFFEPIKITADGRRVKITNGALTLWGSEGQLVQVGSDGYAGQVKLDSGPTIRVPMSCLDILD